MDNTQHAEDCIWTIKGYKHTKGWYENMNIKNCPNCNAPVEVTEDEDA